jgi:hypothetical protein
VAPVASAEGDKARGRGRPAKEISILLLSG